MSCTMAKLYASVVANRLANWARDAKAISSVQKRFMEHEGCFEHNFVLQTALDDARRRCGEVVVAWLDLANAFGSIPHQHIQTMLGSLGVPSKIQSVVAELYSRSTTTIRTRDGETQPIHIGSGVRQGCPLSPIVFNLAIEPLLRVAISLASSHGYRLYDNDLAVLAYADDLALLAKDQTSMQILLDSISATADWMGLKFKPAKCATLDVMCRRKRAVLPTPFTIQGGSPRILGEGEHYQHLGVPTGFRKNQTPQDSINSIIEDAEKIDKSLLAPWQKLEALNMFVMSRLDFLSF